MDVGNPVISRLVDRAKRRQLESWVFEDIQRTASFYVSLIDISRLPLRNFLAKNSSSDSQFEHKFNHFITDTELFADLVSCIANHALAIRVFGLGESGLQVDPDLLERMNPHWAVERNHYLITNPRLLRTGFEWFWLRSFAFHSYLMVETDLGHDSAQEFFKLTEDPGVLSIAADERKWVQRCRKAAASSDHLILLLHPRLQVARVFVKKELLEPTFRKAVALSKPGRLFLGLMCSEAGNRAELEALWESVKSDPQQRLEVEHHLRYSGFESESPKSETQLTRAPRIQTAKRRASKPSAAASRYPLPELIPKDQLLKYPVWQSLMDHEAKKGQDESWLRPLPKKSSIPENGLFLAVGAEATTLNGRVLDAMITLAPVSGFYFDVFLWIGDMWLPLEFKNSKFTKRLAAATGLSPDEIFPLTVQTRARVEDCGHPWRCTIEQNEEPVWSLASEQS